MLRIAAAFVIAVPLLSALAAPAATAFPATHTQTCQTDTGPGGGLICTFTTLAWVVGVVALIDTRNTADARGFSSAEFIIMSELMYAPSACVGGLYRPSACGNAAAQDFSVPDSATVAGTDCDAWTTPTPDIAGSYTLTSTPLPPATGVMHPLVLSPPVIYESRWASDDLFVAVPGTFLTPVLATATFDSNAACDAYDSSANGALFPAPAFSSVTWAGSVSDSALYTL